MILGNIRLGAGVDVHETSSINNVVLGDGVKIGKRCSIFGGAQSLEIGAHSYVGMNTILNGYAARLRIGSHCSLAQGVNAMTDSGPNASKRMQRLFPLVTGDVLIGDHCWIGANAVILPGVVLGDFCVVAANSMVRGSFPEYSVIAGLPARVVRRFTEREIAELRHDG